MWDSNFPHALEETDGFLLREDGRPANYNALILARACFALRNQVITVARLSRDLVLPYEVVDCMCKQLALVDILQPTASYGFCYKYNLNCQDVGLQSNLEASFA